VQHFDAVKQELMKTGMVENVALSNLNTLQMGSSSENFQWDGKQPNEKVLITIDQVGPEYIATSGMQMRYGRDFGPVAKQDSLNVIINEAFARVMKKENPVGSTIIRDSINYTVIGVVKDFVFGDMYGKSDPLIFFIKPEYANYMYIRIGNKANTEQAVDRITSVMRSLNPGYPFDYRFVDDQFDKLFKSETLISKLSRIFAILAIFISCLGLFGLAAYTAERRTREIGIRKVLGASVNGIAGLLSVDFLKLVFISFLIAFPLAWWAMHKWLEDFAYRITINWLVFVFAGITALLIALLTISFQAIRAGLANPVKSLRTE
jgi:ABC-type antimicrobial peptide transport system permease subunit